MTNQSILAQVEATGATKSIPNPKSFQEKHPCATLHLEDIARGIYLNHIAFAVSYLSTMINTSGQKRNAIPRYLGGKVGAAFVADNGFANALEFVRLAFKLS
jgi:hypothetical protein